MPKIANPDVRDRLIELAAARLAARQPVSLRSLADAAGTSTMALYTHFGGMPGLWQAVREAAFGTLAEHLDRIRYSDDPVADLMEVGSAYVTNALSHPDLYLVMFDTRGGVDQPESAATTFAVLVAAVQRAIDAGRFVASTDAAGAALELWAMTHGMVMLVITEAIWEDELNRHLPSMAAAAHVGFGDDPAAARRSVMGIVPIRHDPHIRNDLR
ncbi:TetR/AcrR family transcriptional regulator [soil metagenome]